MSPRRTSSATSRPPSRKSRPTTKTSSKRKRESSTTRGSSRKKNTEPSRLVYLGLGSNLGNRRSFLIRALAQIRQLAPVLAVSSLYRSDPVGRQDQPDFANAVAAIAWHGSPEGLLAALKDIERDLGRVKRFRGGPREIDLDILDFTGMVETTPGLILPHPRISERRFVLAPLAEIAPQWTHPVTGQTAKESMARLPDRPGVRRLRAPLRVPPET